MWGGWWEGGPFRIVDSVFLVWGVEGVAFSLFLFVLVGLCWVFFGFWWVCGRVVGVVFRPPSCLFEFSFWVSGCGSGTQWIVVDPFGCEGGVYMGWYREC